MKEGKAGEARQVREPARLKAEESAILTDEAMRLS
jgi:hypothetical protein